LLKREDFNQIDSKAPYEDLLNEDLNDMDDDELNAYIISDENEVNQRHLEWSILNKEYLKSMDEKASLKRVQADEDATKPTLSNKSVSFTVLFFYNSKHLTFECNRERNAERLTMIKVWKHPLPVKQLRLPVKPKISP